MITQFFDTITKQYVGPEREGPYVTDGAAGALEPHIVEHQVIRTAAPTNLAANERISGSHWVTDEQAKTKTLAWDVETFTPGPWRITKDTLMLRVAAHGDAKVIALDDVLLAQSRAQQILWRDFAWFSSDNANVRALISAIGLDPDEILAPESPL